MAKPDKDSASNLADIEKRLPAAEALLAESAAQGVDAAHPEDALKEWPEQLAAFQQITAMTGGMVLLTGGPGTGKASYLPLFSLMIIHV